MGLDRQLWCDDRRRRKAAESTGPAGIGPTGLIRHYAECERCDKNHWSHSLEAAQPDDCGETRFHRASRSPPFYRMKYTLKFQRAEWNDIWLKTVDEESRRFEEQRSNRGGAEARRSIGKMAGNE